MLKLGEPEKRWHPRRWRAWTSVFYIVFCIVDANRLPESVAQYAKVCTARFRLEFTAVVTQTFTKDARSAYVEQLRQPSLKWFGMLASMI